jgi:fructose-specific component phosphotransferase system IIB-like protein
MPPVLWQKGKGLDEGKHPFVFSVTEDKCVDAPERMLSEALSEAAKALVPAKR